MLALALVSLALPPLGQVATMVGLAAAVLAVVVVVAGIGPWGHKWWRR